METTASDLRAWGRFVGDWVQSIVEMHELVELYDLKVARELGGSMIEDQAENLPD